MYAGFLFLCFASAYDIFLLLIPSSFCFHACMLKPHNKLMKRYMPLFVSQSKKVMFIRLFLLIYKYFFTYRSSTTTILSINKHSCIFYFLFFFNIVYIRIYVSMEEMYYSIHAFIFVCVSIKIDKLK